MSAPLTLLDLPYSDRPRERLERLKPSVLSDRELLAMVLRSGHRSGNAMDLAAQLLVDAGSVHDLSTTSTGELQTFHGMGLAKAAAVVSSFELGRRAAAPAECTEITTSEAVHAVVAPLFDGLRHERVVVVVADTALRVKRVDVVSEGSIDRALISARDILHAVLRVGGAAFAIAHNHPSGVLDPSDEDRRATHAVRAAANTVGLRFLEHVIVAGRRWTSVT